MHYPVYRHNMIAHNRNLKMLIPFWNLLYTTAFILHSYYRTRERKFEIMDSILKMTLLPHISSIEDTLVYFGNLRLNYPLVKLWTESYTSIAITTIYWPYKTAVENTVTLLREPTFNWVESLTTEQWTSGLPFYCV